MPSHHTGTAHDAGRTHWARKKGSLVHETAMRKVIVRMYMYFEKGFIYVKYLLYNKYDDMLKLISSFKAFIFYTL